MSISPTSISRESTPGSPEPTRFDHVRARLEAEAAALESDTDSRHEEVEETRAEVGKAKKRGRPRKNQEIQDTDAAPPTREVKYTLLIISLQELKKPVKEQVPISSCFTLEADAKFDQFKAHILSKVVAALGLQKTDFDAYMINYRLPRRGKTPCRLLDANDYQTLLETIGAIKNAASGIAVTVTIREIAPASESEKERARRKVRAELVNSGRKKRPSNTTSQEKGEAALEDEIHSDEESAKPAKRPRASKPKESDVSGINLELAENIKALRERWRCNSTACPGEYCYIFPDDDKHLALTNKHYELWASAMIKGPEYATLEKPPAHSSFDVASNNSRPSTLLQRRAAAQNQANSGKEHGPVVNINLPAEMISLFARSGGPGGLGGPTNVITPPTPACSTLSPMLLPSGSKTGVELSLEEFGVKYRIATSVITALLDAGYTGTHTFEYIAISELKELGLKLGAIAEMRAAVMKWIRDA